MEKLLKIFQEKYIKSAFITLFQQRLSDAGMIEPPRLLTAVKEFTHFFLKKADPLLQTLLSIEPAF